MAKSGAFDHVETWVFDLDNTLYPHHCNLFIQVERRMGEFICEYLKVEWEEARRLQKLYFRTHGTTLSGLMTEHGLAPSLFLDYVHDIDHSPVPANPALDQALARLPGRKIVFTNGTVFHAERVLDRLGIARHFEEIFDIVASDYIPKPRPHGYQRLIERTALDPRRAAMFEDIAHNLKVPHDLGMTTVHVTTTDVEWARDGADGEHVHHTTDDIAGFLAEIAASRAAKMV